MTSLNIDLEDSEANDLPAVLGRVWELLEDNARMNALVGRDNHATRARADARAIKALHLAITAPP